MALISCAACSLPAKSHEVACPHCGARLRGEGVAPRTAVAIMLGLATAITACGDDTSGGGSNAGGENAGGAGVGGMAAFYGVAGSPGDGGTTGDGGTSGDGGAPEGGFAADYGVPGTGGGN
jgi:hypothetical protein